MSLVNSSAIGRAPDNPEGQIAAFSGGSMRGVRFAPTGKHRWGYAFRYRGGRSGASTPAARAAAYLVTGSVATAARLGYSSQANLSTLMTNGSGADSGDWVESPVALCDNGPSNASIPVASGSSVLISVLVTGASANIGMIEAALIDGYDETFYDRSGLSQPPPAPYGSNSPSTEGHLTVALLCHDNVAPLAATNLTPGAIDAGAPESISSTAPVFAGDHRDLNGAYGASSGDGYNDGDYLNQYRIELQAQSGASWNTVWSPTLTADGAMRSSNHFTVTYPGTLTRGTVYRWRAQTSDHFDTWGPLSEWRYFMPANLGLVTLSGSPTGKIETQQPSFAFSWSHQSALSTNAVEIQLYRNGTLSQSSTTISKTVANGSSGTISWAESGFTNLLWGQSYSYRVRGRDTGNAWSSWSELRPFTTNASPGIPDGLSPSNSAIVTSRPLLTARMVDADDTPATGLLLKFRIKDNSGTVLQTRTATYNATTGLWEYQTISADLASYATYRFDAYSYDGTIYSGGVTLEANAAKSAEAIVIYANGPAVTITAPSSGAVLANSTPTVTWTCATQNRYRVRVYEPGTNTVVYERGWITSSGVKSWTIEAGYLRNSHAYELEVGAEDTTPLQGFSARLPFTTSYTPPATVTGMAAVPVAVGDDPFPTAILVQADASTINPALFVCRNIYRDDIVDRPIAQLTSASATAWLDATPASGVTYTYTWRDVAYVDSSHTEQIESNAVISAAAVRLRGVVLSSVIDPENRRVCLTSVQERTRKRGQDKARLMTWGSDKPITFYGVGDYITISGTYRLISTEALLAIDIERQIDRMLDARHTYCYRDERGRRYFVTIDDASITDRRVLNADLAMTLIEEAYTEGLRPGGGV